MPAGRPIGSKDKNRKKLKEFPYDEYLQIKAENTRKLDEILNTPDYMEILGKKYYGERWFTVLPEGHFKRKERFDKLRKGEISVTGYIDKAVIQLDLDGNVIEEWESSRIWAEENNRAYSAAQHVAKCAQGVDRGGNETAYGYRWKFKEDE